MSESHNTAEIVELKVDGRTLQAPKGKNLLEALLDAGEDISYFCYHPCLSVAACCRQCLVSQGGRMIPSCQMTVQPGMEIESNSPAVLEARRAVLELTLANHPLDCVICDKAGECALQRLYMEWNGEPSAVAHAKVEKPKKVDLGPEIVLDAERCILCSRCVRFCAEIAHSPQLVFEQRGDHSTVTTAPGHQLDNAYSLNTVDICPVGALTDKDFRFQIRVWELYATQSVCNGCAAGCPMEIHHRDGVVFRLVPPKRWDMNLNWMCNYGRRTYKRLQADRLTTPLVDGQPAEPQAALDRIARDLRELLTSDSQSIGVVLGADASNEDNFAALSFGAGVLEAGQVYLAERPDDGNGDNILRKSDPNPNRAGARAVAGGQPKSAADLAQDLAAQRLKALYVIGDVLELSDETLSRLSDLRLVVVQAAQSSRLTRAAHVVLPAATWAEIDGTVTNHANKVQRMRPAIEPPGHARPHWDWICRLSNAMGLTPAFQSADTVFAAMKQQLDFFADAEWGPQIPTTLLRFAGRRG